MDVDEEIAKLEEEVAKLEDAVKHQQDQNRLSRAWKEYQQYKVEDEEEEVSRAKLQSLKNQVSWLKNITDIAITDVSTHIVGQDNLKVLKKKQVNGSCGNIEFQLNMDIKESMDSDEAVHSVVTHLSISASESVYRDLKDIVEQLAEAGDVHGFCTVLRAYSTWQDARERVHQHFVATFPNIVKKKDLQTLVITHPVKKCSFEIIWHFKVWDLYSVRPDLQMIVHVPEKVKSSSRDFLQTVPEKFQLMLTQLGVEKTLNCLVTSLEK